MRQSFFRRVRIRNPLWLAALAALLVFVLLAGLAEWALWLQARDVEARTQSRIAAQGATLRAHLDRELNSILYLSSGLSGYLVVHRDQLEGTTIRDMLAVLHRSAAHVRNFGISVGYRLAYVYPREGNEKAIGVDYRDLPNQWPVVQRTIEKGTPVLAGPLQLVQGGRGMVYRVPVMVEGRYWGLLSTVIDADSLLASVFRDVPQGVEVAVRGKDGQGADGEVFWGDGAVFEDSRVLRISVDIPGGSWQFAIRSDRQPSGRIGGWIARIAALLVSAIISWGVYLLILQRQRLAQLALYDTLTGLPNRRLLEDRLESAVSRQQRQKDAVCAVLFVDLDGFKGVNDRLGHKAGDIVLTMVARRARKVVRIGDTVARIGGDELVLVLDNTQRSEIGAVVRRLDESIRQPIPVDSVSVSIGASIGVAISPEDGAGSSELIKVADERMYEAKRRNREKVPSNE